MSTETMAANRKRVYERFHEMVKIGALESAVTFESIYSGIFSPPNDNLSSPEHPNHKPSGLPGPGGLVLYMSFDKPDIKGVVRDESGAGNDGSVIGAQWVEDGKFGGAYRFHITNLTDRITISNTAMLNPDYITVTAWIRAADEDGFWNRIVDKDWNNGYCLGLGGDYNGKGSRGKVGFESGPNFVVSDRALNDNRWHHVAGAYDGNMVRCYIDGVEKSASVKNPATLKKNNWDLCIGNSVVEYGTGELLAFDGLIREVRIYNRALSLSEIKQLAAQ